MPIFARFSAKYPEIELHVQVSNKYVSLAERQADVGVAASEAAARAHARIDVHDAADDVLELRVRALGKVVVEAAIQRGTIRER